MKLVIVMLNQLLNFMFRQNGVLKIPKINKLQLVHLIILNLRKSSRMLLPIAYRCMNIYLKMELGEKLHEAYCHCVLIQNLFSPVTSILSCTFSNYAYMLEHNMKLECMRKHYLNLHYHTFLYLLMNGSVFMQQS